MTPMSFSDYLNFVAFNLKVNPTWRAGQAYFNALSSLYPEIAETYRGTAFDPFYKDERIPKFLADLRDNHVNY